jgi:hypothetical protein
VDWLNRKFWGEPILNSLAGTRRNSIVTTLLIKRLLAALTSLFETPLLK